MIIIAAVCFAVFFVDIHRFYAKWNLNFKPFNCASCLSSWIALFLFLFPIAIPYVFYMFVAGVLAPIIKLLMDYLYKLVTR
jgi:hypothetical protein